MFYLILLFISFIAYCFFINRILGLPNGPPPLPIIGNMLSFEWNFDKKLLEWKEKYGRIFTIWIPFPVVVFGDHKVLTEEIGKNGDLYLGRRNPEQLMDIMAGGLCGLAFEDNDIVKEQRRFALRTFHELGFGSTKLEDTVYGYVQEVVARWKKQHGQEINVTDYLMCATGNIIWNITFGVHLDFDDPLLPRFREIQQATLPLMAGTYMQYVEMFPIIRKFDFLFGNHARRLHEILHRSSNFVKEAIGVTRKSFHHDDHNVGSFVDAFLLEMKRREDNGIKKGNFNERQMIYSAWTIWSAGFDTTVTVLRMCIFYLMINPDKQLRLQQEIDQVIGKRRIHYMDHKSLPYASAYLQEIYRLANVLPLSLFRRVMKDTVVEGWELPEGTTVLPQHSMVHIDPKEFVRPTYFCPERHLNDQGQYVKDPRITPFSMGKRSCIGESLARMEIFVMFITFLQHLSFESPTIVPPKIKYIPGFTRTPEYFTVIVKDRDSL